MRSELTLFGGTFATLLAIINPLEVMPVYLELLAGKDQTAHRAIARKACTYAMVLSFFFLVFGDLFLRIFGVPLAMVRIAGGLILTRIGFSLFMPQTGSRSLVAAAGPGANIAFVPLAMPLMFGPGAIATIISLTAQIRESPRQILAFLAVTAAILATMIATYFCLANAVRLTKRISPLGIDAATRIVGFFVSAIGISLIFTGVVEALQMHGFTSLH
jgi:multiple antibiotic resistance protein